MTQKGVRILTREDYEMSQKLKVGYPNQKEKLEEAFYGEKQENSETKFVIADNDNRQPSENPIHREKIKRQSNRVFGGRKDIVIKYPKSGKEYEATIRRRKYKVAIEPIKPNRAFWIVDQSFIDNNSVVDLRTIPYERQIHNKKGREIMSDFR